VADSFPSC